MKKSGNKKENLQDTWGNLVNKVANLPNRLLDAVDEGFQEATEQASNLRCAKNALLDFPPHFFDIFSKLGNER